jgi:hypothetical protein
MISLGDAACDPKTMMIKIFNAVITRSAMRRLWWSLNSAGTTKLSLANW